MSSHLLGRRPTRGSFAIWCKERDHWEKESNNKSGQLLSLEVEARTTARDEHGAAIGLLRAQRDVFLQRLQYSNDRHLVEVYRAKLIMSHLDSQTASRVFDFTEEATRDDTPYDAAQHVWNDSDDSLQRLLESFRDLDVALIVSIGRYSRSSYGRKSKAPVVAAAGSKNRESTLIDWEAERKRLDEEGRRALRAISSDVDAETVKLCFSWFDVERRCKMQEHIDSLREQCAPASSSHLVSGREAPEPITS